MTYAFILCHKERTKYERYRYHFICEYCIKIAYGLYILFYSVRLPRLVTVTYYCYGVLFVTANIHIFPCYSSHYILLYVTSTLTSVTPLPPNNANRGHIQKLVTATIAPTSNTIIFTTSVTVVI